MRFYRGQSSIELISILSVALLVLGVLLVTSRSAFEDMQNALASKMTENSLTQLSMNAKMAYSGGPGSILRTTLHIPDTVISNESYAYDGIVNIRLEHKYGVKDIPQKFDIPITSNLNFRPGDYDVYSISHNGYVFLTENPSLSVDRVIIYFDQKVGDASEKEVAVMNPGFSESHIKVEMDDKLRQAGLAVDWTLRSIGPGKSTPLKLSFSSNQPILTSGNITLKSDSGEYEKITVRINVR
ncbi:MAG: hypothetical protein ACP5H8_00140 [Candidatus Micrarchaeia archaeon]